MSIFDSFMYGNMKSKGKFSWKALHDFLVQTPATVKKVSALSTGEKDGFSKASWCLMSFGLWVVPWEC